MISALVGFVQRLVGAQTIQEIIYDRLLPNEEIFMVDGPATIALFIHRLRSIIAFVLFTVGAFVAPGRGLTVVFVKTKFGADKVVRKLAGHKIEAVALHGNHRQPWQGSQHCEPQKGMP